uniref:Si:dkey-246g23.4 n=1 Tax=Sinocyclocheilus rhinocerous TaxID=307959 RepID=A0A673FPQ3_9TELE
MELQRKSRTVRPAGPLDGGYGWFIVLSTFLVFGLTFGVIKSFGVFFVEIHHYFATTATTSSWITSISVATVHFGAPVGSALSAYFGHRPVVMVGGLLSSIGMVAGSYAQDLLQLYITVGFLTGKGATSSGAYGCTHRRPVANVLASTGESILSFILTPSIQFMVDQYSWRGAMLILGALQLNLCLCRALLRPLNRHVPPKELIEEKEHELELLSQTYTDSKSSNNRSDSKKSDPLKVKIIRYMDYTLIANARFMVYSVFGVFAALGFFAPSLFLVPYARSQGMEEYQTVHQLIVTVILLGIVLLLCPLATTFTQLLFSAGYGLVFGATVAIYITVLAEVEVIIFYICDLFIYLFVDKMSDYGAGFLMADVALLVSALFQLVLQQMNKKGTEKVKLKLGERERT